LRPVADDRLRAAVFFVAVFFVAVLFVGVFFAVVAERFAFVPSAAFRRFVAAAVDLVVASAFGAAFLRVGAPADLADPVRPGWPLLSPSTPNTFNALPTDNFFDAPSS
jgi:hypothetical protein